MQLNLHATRRTPHGASRLVQAVSSWSVKTGRAPSRHFRGARVYGHTATATHDMVTPLPLIPRVTQLMADKMRLYAGDEDVDLEELERALTIVRRKMTDPESFPGFLENPEVRASKENEHVQCKLSIICIAPA